MKTITLMRFQSLALLCVLAACSTDSPLIAYTVDTPPLILMPIAQSSVIDDRGRFREILCAINEERGKNLPAYRPCKDTLHHQAPSSGSIPLTLMTSLVQVVQPI